MKKRFAFTLHNLIGHPLMEVLHLLGFEKLSNRVHDSTLPPEGEAVEKPTYRCGYCGSDREPMDQEALYGPGAVGYSACPDCGGV